MTSDPMRQIPIAVVGVGALFPGSVAHDGYWRNILDGKDLVKDVPPEHWLIEDYYDPDPTKPGKSYGKRGAFLDKIGFDPLDHAIPPNNLAATDTAQLLALIVAKRVLADACRTDFSNIDRSRVSVILGVASATELAGTMSGSLQYPLWARAMREEGLSEDQLERIVRSARSRYAEWGENTFPGLLGNVVAGRIASRFGLGGANCVVDAACASSLGALRMAVQELSLGQSDLVITGGVDALNDVFMFVCFSRTPALSPTGDCRPFASDADGTVLGEGVGMLALRRLEDAERDNDKIYAVLRGVGASSDGRAKSIYAPRPEGQALAIERAFAAAGYGPETVELLEAHGTGTIAGDLAELEGLAQVFGRSARRDRPWCAIGSVKSQIGHTKGAAGAAALIKAVLSLHHKALPPTIKIGAPHASLTEDGVAFYANTTLRPWIRGKRHPRRASVSSFGFGGSNFHVTLEEYAGPAPRPALTRHLSSELFLFSAKERGGLDRAFSTTRERAAEPGGFAASARASQANFDRAAPLRLALVAKDIAEFDALHARFDAIATQQLRVSQPGLHWASGPTVSGPIAFLFPGQGSQYVGMSAGLALAFETARAPWDDVADATEEEMRLLPRVVFPPPVFSDAEKRAQDAALTKTERAQPAIALASLAYLALLEAVGVRPAMVGGHSFGELTALCAAGAFPKSQLVSLAIARGKAMQAAAGDAAGAMLAVFASRAKVEAAASVEAKAVVIANHNAPDQIVVAGADTAIETLERELSAEGVHTRRLSVSAAFHSPLVAAAQAPFADVLRTCEFAPLSVPVYANATARPYASSEEIAETLAEQIVREVRFCEEIEAMHAQGARIFIEVGPGAALSELAGRCLAGQPHIAVALDGKARDEVWRFWSALGKLAVEGVALDLAPLWNGYEVEPAQDTPSPISVEINGSNYGKRYPAQESQRPPPEPPKRAASVAPPPPAPRAPIVSAISLANEKGAAPMADDRRLESLVEIIRASSEAHQVAQKAMADAHIAYLQATEAVLTQLTGAERRPSVAASAPSLLVPAPAAPRRAPPTPVVMAPTPRPEPLPMPAPAPLARPSPPAPIAAASAPRDMTSTILDIVSAKTGYPAAMLSPDMELERDLGIDSIKRVEILAALREALPDLPQVEMRELAGLSTLRAIGERLGASPPAALSPAPEQARPAPKLFRSIVEMIEAPTAPIAPRPRRMAIEDSPLSMALCAALRERGVEAACFSDAPDAEADGLVLFALGDGESADKGARAIRAAQAFARNGRAGGMLATVQDTGGDFGLSGRCGARAWTGAMSGLAKTAAKEWPLARVKAIDIEQDGIAPAALAERLADELLCGGGVEIGLLADGRRVSLRETAQALAPASNGRRPLPENAVLIVSGAQGVTPVCARALAAAHPVRLVFLGRTALCEVPAELAPLSEVELRGALARRAEGAASPQAIAARAKGLRASVEIDRLLRELAEAGVEACYHSVDVADTGALRSALDSVRRRWGRIDGFVHGAGVLADKLIEANDATLFGKVFAPKVGGLQALLDATADDDLSLIALFGSVAGRFGNSGQSSYAMANEALNKIARVEAARRGDACLVRAFNWGPWDAGMVTPELKRHFEAQGIAAIALEDGARTFVEEILNASSNPAEVEIVLAAAGSASA